MKQVYDDVTCWTDAFCDEFLNDEYKVLARSMTAALCRKRPSPLLTSNPKTWACGTVYALGKVNFLFDKSSEPYMRADDLCGAFQIGASTGSAKAKAICDLLKIRLLDPSWCLPSRLINYPMAWLIMVDDLLIDARYAPKDVQEEAYRLGYIPFIPPPREPTQPRATQPVKSTKKKVRSDEAELSFEDLL